MGDEQWTHDSSLRCHLNSLQSTIVGWVPAIDVSGPPADVAMALDEACRRTGFLTITGHGVDPVLIAGVWKTAKAFFDLPEADKQQVAMPYAGYPYGYSPIAYETLSMSVGQQAPPDIKESYAIGPLDPPAASPRDADGASVYSPNLWPDEVLPDLRPAWEAYFRAMAGLSARILQLAARALGLPHDYFEPLIDRHTSAMRALNYPAIDRPVKPGQLRASAHTDYGTLTILLQEDKPGGLEVRRPDGSWAPVPATPGSFVVNLGDAMARWSNDRWVSTLHRVVLPPEGAGGSARRQSIAFFHNANWDARIECLPTCLAPGETPHYTPVEAGPHLMAKFRSTVGAAVVE